jgi:flavin reductase (DIM6/NTAB) family NADH-FMN oxidoreductase RutF
MEGLFKKVNINTLTENYFNILNNDWGLLTAGKTDNFNTMTVSWGSFGIMWNRPVIFCFVRPQRYTFEFMNKNHYFTLSFFTDEYKKALEYCGEHSGRDIDKVKKSELVPYTTDLRNIIFEQTRLAFECKKLYSENLKPEAFLDQSIIKSTYQKGDFHRMYVGEIVNCFKPF